MAGVGRAWIASGLLALAASAGAQEATGPEPTASPASWITPDDYPASAIRAKAEGRTVAALGVDASGKVTSCRVESSSGNAALDAATCAVLTTRAAFRPARDANGRAVASTYTMPVRWALPASTPPLPIEVTAPGASLDTDIAVELSLDGEGKLLECRALSSKVPTPGPRPVTMNPCEPFKPGQQLGPAVRRNGRPVASKVVQRMSRQVTVAP